MAYMRSDPHHEGGILTGGPSLEEAAGALILLHGRGGSAADMIGLGQEIGLRGLAMLAPQAAEHSWYPNSFLAPIEANEPWLTSALNRIGSLIELCSQYFSSSRIAVIGFSQGACLASEFIARHPRRYAALIALTGGLLGPLGSDLHHPGSLDGTPVLLSSGDPDPHVPWERVEETGQQFRSMHASVTVARFPHRPHTILSKELDAAQNLLCSALRDWDNSSSGS